MFNEETEMNIHQQLEANQSRRMKAESRYLDRIIQREDNAELQIGTLMRNGKEINYVWPTGGRFREGSRSELIDFLIRNNYA